MKINKDEILLMIDIINTYLYEDHVRQTELYVMDLKQKLENAAATTNA